MTATTKAAFVGITHPHTSGRLKAALARGDVEIVGAADDSPLLTPFTDHFGLPRLSVQSALTDPDVDAVFIHSKSRDMADFAVTALRAGKHVLVEKPGGRNPADLARIADTADATGLVAQIGYTYRYSGAIDFSRHIIAAGMLGDLVQVRVHGGCSLNEAASSHINNDDDMGAALWVIGSHLVDLLLAHLGPPLSVNARTTKLAPLKSATRGEDAAVVTLNYTDVLVGFDFMSWDPAPWVETWEIAFYGTKGILHVRPLPASWRLYLREPTDGHPAGWSFWQQTSFPVPWAATTTDYSPELAEIANSELFKQEIDHFLAEIAHPRGSQRALQDALDTARVIAACYQSSAADGKDFPL